MNLRSLAASRLAGRPWAIAPSRLDALLASTRALTGGTDLPPWLHEAARSQGYAVTDAGIAVVPVLGPLVARGDWLTMLLGAGDYGAIVEALTTAAGDPAVRGIVLEVDSPGGEVGGLFDLVDAIAATRQRSGKPLWAVASEAALSAAYAIASAADRLYVTRTGEAGSVGVVAAHLDESGADAATGRQWTLIHAGARKTDANPHQPLSPQAAADIQADVDHLYDQLVALVAANRGLSAAAVRATEAAIYRGEKAVAAGLADRLGTVTQAITDLQATLDTKRIRAGPPARRPLDQLPAARRPSPPARTCAMTNPEPSVDDTGAAPPSDAAGKTAQPLAVSNAVAEAPSQSAYGAARPQPASDPDAHAIAERLRAEYAEIATVAAQAGRLGIDIDAAEAMRRGLTPDAMRRTLLDQLAARSESANVVAIAPQPATGGESPIVKRARERAASRSPDSARG